MGLAGVSARRAEISVSDQSERRCLRSSASSFLPKELVATRSSPCKLPNGDSMRWCRVLVLVCTCILSACGGPDQADEGDGWVLLGSELSASDPVTLVGDLLFVSLEESSYHEDWSSGHMSAPPPPVNFDTHLVVRSDRFANDHCNEVVFEGLAAADHSIVELVFLGPSGRACESWGFAHVVFIAVERDSLPSTPFAFQVGEGQGALTVQVEDL
jgi:hypothetical protein